VKTASRSPADGLKRQAEQLHRQRGLAAAVEAYVQAADALSRERRPLDAASMLGALLGEGRARPRRRMARHAAHQRARPASPAPAAKILELRRALADALVQAGDLPGAISEYEEMLKADPLNPTALRALAECYIAAGTPKVAADRLQRGVDVGMATGDLAFAADAATRLAAIRPDSIDARRQQVELLRTLGDIEVIPALEQLAELYATRGPLTQELAVCKELYALQPDRKDVKQRIGGIYTVRLQADPHDEEAWNGLRALDPDLAEQVAVLLMDVRPIKASAG
jgi:tetratricopeptide (TPR) repeat protein